MMTSLVLALLFGFSTLLLWALLGPPLPAESQSPPERLGVTPEPSFPQATLRIVTWNIAWGFGLGSEGSIPWRSRTPEELRSRITAIGEWLRTNAADVVLLQEVDFDSRRSHRIDQLALLAQTSGLNYAARALSWKVNHLPFPFGWPERHFGRIRSGGAVLSRYPLGTSRIERLPKPSHHSALYRAFYLSRYVQRIEIDLGTHTVAVYNVHLEAFDLKNRSEQAMHLAARLARESTPWTLVGGDFNTVPPESPAAAHYPDEPETDHRSDPTLERLRGVMGLRDLVSEERFVAAPAAWYTFPADAPNRMLDHLFAGEALRLRAIWVDQEIGALSDHLPLIAELEWPS